MKTPGITVFLLAAHLAVPALAQTPAQAPAPDRAACEALVARADREAAVAPATYQPGVDVRGNPVVGANLNPQPQIILPDEVTIPVQPLVAGYLDRALPPALEGMRVNAGELVIRLADGRVTFNGQVVGGDTNAALVEACRNLLAAPEAEDPGGLAP